MPPTTRVAAARRNPVGTHTLEEVGLRVVVHAGSYDAERRRVREGLLPILLRVPA